MIMTRYSSRIIAAAALSLLIFSLSLAARQIDRGEATRKLWYPGMTAPTTPAKRRYRVRTPNQPLANVTEDTVLGVTIFRLRPPRLGDPKTRLLTHSTSGDIEWTPVRVGYDSSLDVGSLVRLSIETSRGGYLYVIDREQYAGGELGPPVLIFPTTKIRRGANEVSAGRVTEIPDRDDYPSYFTLKRGRRDHSGELLTIIVTPQPLDDIKIGPEPIKLLENQVREMEKKWGEHKGRLELIQGTGTTWTSEEKTAGENPQYRLKAGAPVPQTIYYNDSAKPSDILLANVRLRLNAQTRQR